MQGTAAFSAGAGAASGGGASSGAASGGASGSATSASASASASAAAGYTCEICLDEPTEPVVTYCGHLYCWPCLFRWMHATTGTTTHHNQCPVCKSEISHSTVIPLYGRGRERDPRSASGGGGGGGGAAAAAAAGGGGVHGPARPPAQRTDSAPQGGDGARGGAGGGAGGAAGFGADGAGANVQFAAGFGFFPRVPEARAARCATAAAT